MDKVVKSDADWRAQLDDMAYKVAAAEMAGKANLSSELLAKLLSQFPNFDAERFVGDSAYTDAGYRDALAKPLMRAIERANC